jgi:hypothetical protein
MSDELPNKPAEQADAAEPVIENPKGQYMDAQPSRPRRIGRRIVLMDQDTLPAAPGTGRMQPVPREAATAAPDTQAALPDQEASRPSGTQAEGYVRMRVRVENNQMSIIGARAVEGPLLMPNELHSGFAYEVAVGGKRIGVDTIPDLGESRSFPDPEGRPEMQGHHIEVETSYEFSIRVPRNQMSFAALPRMQIVLYRVKERTPVMPIGAGALSAQFSRELREIARLSGVRVASLPAELQAELRQSLR